MQSKTLLLANLCFFLFLSSFCNFLPQALAKKCIGDNDVNIIDPSPDCPDPDSNAEIDESSKAEAAVQQAIKAYTNNTCIRFVSRSNQSDYIHIHSGKGCYSALGRTGGQQPLSLARGCQFKGTAIHELMHALGFLHEQSRPDRDEFVEILWHNIKSGKSTQFVKGDSDQYTTLGIDYDYSSILHYRATMFSANGEPTIVPKKAGVEIGQRLGLSTLDAEKINALYNCNGISGETTTSTVKPTSTDKPTTKGGCFDKLPLDICEKYKERICSSTKVECCRKTCNLCVSITTTETLKPELEC